MNVSVPLLTTQRAVRLMQRVGRERIVNIASISACAPARDGCPRYVEGRGHRAHPADAIEFATDGISVNAVAPGPVDTP